MSAHGESIALIEMKMRAAASVDRPAVNLVITWQWAGRWGRGWGGGAPSDGDPPATRPQQPDNLSDRSPPYLLAMAVCVPPPLVALTGWPLSWRRGVFPVRYGLKFKYYLDTQAHVESGSNTCTVAPQVVGGDEKRTQCPRV
jgi:hypothetical protein